VKPGSENRSILNRRALPGQREKCCLKGIFGIGVLAENEATDSEHHRPVTLNQGPEGVVGINLISVEKPFDQVLVGELSGPLPGVVSLKGLHLRAGHIKSSIER
jgi:hypothetical protein